ncbi:hypothetical protein [uncultured Polaribacter sp.]|uniref:acyloxyacyl hydrolase n=1 Tax=uncultured Polaribacter sp. TaxID=174711 RepID=UPI0032B1A551
MKYVLIVLFFSSFLSFAQGSQKKIFNIQKIGFLYNNAFSNNFIFNDKDFTYTTSTFKIQAFYNLGTWKSLDFELIAQPQYQVLKHQLINKYFVLPSEHNYQVKIKEFTTPKTMHLYAFELGFVIKKALAKKLDFLVTIGLGLASIDTRSERLAKGFTFIENGSLGFSYKISNKTLLYLGSNIGHVSNLDFQMTNAGFSVIGFEAGISSVIK